MLGCHKSSICKKHNICNKIRYAAAAAKLLQLCPTLCDPIDGSPPGSQSLGFSGKNTGVGCHFLLQCMKVKSESEVIQSCPLLATPWIAAHQDPLCVRFSRRDYWSGVPLPSLTSKVGVSKRQSDYSLDYEC